MAVTTSSFSELLWPGIKKIFGTDYKAWSPVYPQIFQMETSDKAFEKMQQVTGFGLAGKKAQGGMIPYTMPYQGGQKEIVNETYGIGTIITREAFEDDQYRFINKLPSMLARSMRQTEEVVAHNILNRAFNSAYTGIDGKELCADNHLLVRGGTYANEPAAAADLTQTSLENAISALKQFVDDAGLHIVCQPRALVIPTQLEITARKILESTQVTGSADNDKNVIRGVVPLIVSPFLTDDDTWFILTDIPDGLLWFWRRRTEATRENEHDTQTMKFATSARYSCGWLDPRGIYGVPGA